MGKVMDFTVNLSMLTSGNFNTTVGPAAENMRKLSQQVQNLQRVSGNITGFQKQTQKLDTLRQKLAAAQAKVKDFQTRKRQGEIIDPKAFTRAHEEAARLQKTVQENSRALGTFRNELKAAGVDTKDLAGAQAQLQAQTERAKAAQEKLVSAQKRFADIQGRLSWGNIQADVMKSAMLLKAFQQPIQVTMNFDQAMAQVRAVKTMTDEEFAKLETQAKELGATTVYSATQAANTQENLARAGMSIPDITAALPAVLSMAGAEGMDLAQAGSIIAKGLGGMGLEGKYAGRLADVLAYTSASSNTNIVEIGDAFKVVAPVLSKQGATMEQIASYIGVMTNKGYTGSEAGNALASTTMRLANLPKKARDKLLNIGLDPRRFKTKEGRMVELPEIMKMLDRAMKAKNLGEFEQLDILSEVFGKSQGKAMSAFLSASAAGAADAMKNGAYNDSFGKAAEMNRTRNNTLKGDITSLYSAWEGLMIRIGKPLEPMNRFFTQTLTTTIQTLTKFMNEHKGFFDLVIESCYAFGTIKIASTVLKYFRLGIEYFSAWRAVRVAEKGAELATAATNAGNLAANMGSAGNAAGLFGMSLKTALGWIGLIALASYEIYQHWDDIKALWKDLTAPKIEMPNVTSPSGATVPSWQTQGGITLTPQPTRNADMSTLQQKTSRASRSVGGRNRGGWTPHALGGIFTSPHLGLVAEAGPEAIVPLRNRNRGIEILREAAGMLGLPRIALPRIGLPDMGLPRLRLPKFPEIFRNTNSPVSILSGLGGVVNHSENSSILSEGREMINYVSQSSNRNNDSNSVVRDSSMTFNPTYNITVTGSSQEETALNFRQVIEDTMQEMMSRMERVSYA